MKLVELVNHYHTLFIKEGGVYDVDSKLISRN
jgi:hypothetical protein